MKLSVASKKALEIIAANPGISITEFARQMWPFSENWETVDITGKNKGYGMIRASQSYLNRLLRTGWIEEKYHHNGISKKDRKFYITSSGKAELAPPDDDRTIWFINDDDTEAQDEHSAA